MSVRPFRLQAVVRLREEQRDTQRLRFAEALRAEGLLNEQRNTLSKELEELFEDRRKMTALGESSASQFLSTQRYELTLRAQQQTIDENLGKIAEETERRRLALVEAEREVRTLERLKERSEEEQRREEERRETLRLDEFASQQDFARRKQDVINR